MPIVGRDNESSTDAHVNFCPFPHCTLVILFALWIVRGVVGRTNDEPTLFAFSLWRHVDLYTSRVSNLVSFGVTHRFYPTKVMAARVCANASLIQISSTDHATEIWLTPAVWHVVLLCPNVPCVYWTSVALVRVTFQGQQVGDAEIVWDLLLSFSS